MGITACQPRLPVYRANAKLLITYAGRALPTSEIQRGGNATFFATTAGIMRSQVMLRRVQQRMKKTPAEFRENLSDLNITPVRGADIIVVSVDSPSREFARDFANVLCEEYLRFREEQVVNAADSSTLALSREISRLSTELKRIDELTRAWAKEHSVATDADLPELRSLRDEHARVQSLHAILLEKLMKIDTTVSYSWRNVSILEPAVVESAPVGPRIHWRIRLFPKLRKWVRPTDDE